MTIRQTVSLFRVVKWLEGLACFALLMMMLFVTADVGGRYLLGAPLPGAIELVQYALVVVVFAALPSVTFRRRHISLDVIAGHLSGATLRLQWATVCLGSALVMAVQAWLLFNRSQVMRENEDVIGFLNLPVHPAGYFMAALSLLTALTLVVASVQRAPTADHSTH